MHGMNWAPVGTWARRRLASHPSAPPYEGRRGAVPPSAFPLAHGATRTHLFVGKPALPYGSPNALSATGLKALSGRLAVLATEPHSACYERAHPPGFPCGSRVTPRRVVPPPRGHVLGHTGASWDICELWLCFRHSWPHTVTGGREFPRNPRLRGPFAIAHLLFQSRAPGGEFWSSLS